MREIISECVLDVQQQCCQLLTTRFSLKFEAKRVSDFSELSSVEITKKCLDWKDQSVKDKSEDVLCFLQ